VAVLDDLERNLVLDFSTLKPGVVLFSTMKPLTWLSARSRAQMMEHRTMARCRSSLLAVEDPGCRPRASLSSAGRGDAPKPTSGSVRPKQPIFSKRAIGGSHFCFCSSDPSM